MMNCNSTTSTISTSGIYLDVESGAGCQNDRGIEAPLTLPEPNDAISRMLTGDYGTSMAAMLMLSQKEQRQNARNERDSAYRAVENAQHTQIEHMKDAADLKFATGLAQGGLQLTSAGLGLASIEPGVANQTADYQLKTMPEGRLRESLIQNAATYKHESEALTGSAKAIDAFGGISGAGGKLVSDAADREVTGDEQRITTLQRVAANDASDADEANKSIDRTVDLFHEYVNTKNATLLAATQRA